jgi:hypothetical protein
MAGERSAALPAMRPVKSGRARVVQAVALLLVGAVALQVRAQIRAITRPSGRLPLWDMAEHGVDGVGLADAARQFEWASFLAQIHGMDLWPPVFPLIECPVFLVRGFEYDVAEGLMAALAAGGIVAIYLVGLALGGARGMVAGGVGAALMAASPMVHLFGGLVMLELPGVLLLAISLIAYLRYDRTGRRADLDATCVATLLLFLCKYNYGLLWIIAILVNELLEPGVATAARARVLSCWNVRRSMRGPARVGLFPLFLVLYGGFLLAIAVSGGWVWSFAGHELRVRSLGNPVYFLCLILLVRYGLARRNRPAGDRGWLARQPAAHRRFIALTLAPALVWLLVPGHMKGFFHAIENRTSGLPFLSAQSLLYYPRAFVSQYSPSAWLGTIVFALGVVSLAGMRQRARGARILPVALGTSLALATAHRYKEARFLFTVAPLVWIGCGSVIAAAGERYLKWRGAGASALVLNVVLLGLAAGFGFDVAATHRRFEAASAPASGREVLDAIAGEVAGSAGGSVLLGTWNGLSPALVEWHLRLCVPGIEPAALPRGQRQFVRDLGPGSAAAETVIDRIAADPAVERILLLDLPAGAPAWKAEFALENPWLGDTARALEMDERFEMMCDRGWADCGYVLRVYRRVGRAAQRRSRANAG